MPMNRNAHCENEGAGGEKTGMIFQKNGPSNFCLAVFTGVVYGRLIRFGVWDERFAHAAVP